MTLPFERTNAVSNVERFLMELCDPQKTPRLPKEIRRRAGSLLKHYPNSFDMEVISSREDENAPRISYQVFGKYMP